MVREEAPLLIFLVVALALPQTADPEPGPSVGDMSARVDDSTQEVRDLLALLRAGAEPEELGDTGATVTGPPPPVEDVEDGAAPTPDADTHEAEDERMPREDALPKE